MAGMFYSLKEAAQQLGKAEDEVKQLARDGKLREFRDGSNLLFKIDEVNALLAEGLDAGAGELELPAEEPVEAVEDTAVPAAGESAEDEVFQLDEEVAPALEGVGAADEDDIFKLDEEAAETPETPEPAGTAEEDEVFQLDEKTAETPEPVEAADDSADLDLLLEDSQAGQAESPESKEVVPEPELEAPQAAEEPAEEELKQPVGEAGEGSSEEISLAAESGVLAEGSDISDLDTALTGEGVNVLSETDTDYNVTEDSMAETAGPAASAGTSGEASLEEIEDDVNLDSFGSGSGLLDLSLQADDTSLGGILDEIYTAEGGEGEATPTEGEAVDVGEGASFEEITAEAEHAPAEEELAVPESVAVVPTMAPAYAEVAPDAQSNILGMLLFLPMLALLYTAIVTLSAMRGFVPSILSSVQGLIWYMMGGGVVVALVMVGISFTAGREKAPRAAKPVKDKKAKPAKATKAEKPAKEAAAKPAKEKKGFSLFGKKDKKATAS